MTSRKPQLILNSCGNGPYSHCSSASLSWPLTLWLLHAHVRYQNLCPTPQTADYSPSSLRGSSHPVHMYFVGMGGRRGENESNASAVFILSTGILTTTLFINLIIVFLPPPLTHSLQVSEGQTVKQTNKQIWFLKLLMNPESMIWPTWLLVLWSPDAALIQHSKSNITTYSIYYIREIIACLFFFLSDFAMIWATSHRVHGSTLYQIISWGCKSSKNSYCMKFPFTFIHWDENPRFISQSRVPSPDTLIEGTIISHNPGSTEITRNGGKKKKSPSFCLSV